MKLPNVYKFNFEKRDTEPEYVKAVTIAGPGIEPELDIYVNIKVPIQEIYDLLQLFTTGSTERFIVTGAVHVGDIPIALKEFADKHVEEESMAMLMALNLPLRQMGEVLNACVMFLANLGIELPEADKEDENNEGAAKNSTS